MATALRTKARTLDPEAFDPGQPVEHDGRRGVIWCLGPDKGPRKDSRWVVCEDGTARVLMLDKAPQKDGGALAAAFWSKAFEYTPTGARPFDLDAWKSTGEPPMPEELPGMPAEPAEVEPELCQCGGHAEHDGHANGCRFEVVEHRTDCPEPAAEPEQPAQGSRCGSCKGFGLVRASGKRYRFRENALQAQRDGRAVACPDCTAQAA